MDVSTGVLLVQTAVLGLLAIDRWVHSVSGPTPLSSKLDNVRRDVDSILDKASERETKYNDKIGALQLDMRGAQTDIAALKVMAEDNRERLSAIERRRSST